VLTFKVFNGNRQIPGQFLHTLLLKRADDQTEKDKQFQHDESDLSAASLADSPNDSNVATNGGTNFHTFSLRQRSLFSTQPHENNGVGQPHVRGPGGIGWNFYGGCLRATRPVHFDKLSVRSRSVYGC
jgi:hypothetical protein